MPERECWAVLLAAGQGSRLQSATQGQAKQFLPWQGAPLWWASACALAASPLVHGVVLVFPADSMEHARETLHRLDKARPLGIPWCVCTGGERRQDSVRLGLELLPKTCATVLIHDSARPFVSTALVSRVALALNEALALGTPCGGVIPGVPVTDTIKETVVENAGRLVSCTPERACLRAVQTPQAFPLELLRRAHNAAHTPNAMLPIGITDDAMLMEQDGHPVLVIDGDPLNIKITRPEDLTMLHHSPLPTAWPCTGYGYDVHRYGGHRPLVLGGVPIPEGSFAVSAHSDGDVLLHALMDAILGCMAAGDIGQHFSDNDPALSGISSALLLDRVLDMAAETGLRITHVDLTVVAQKPKLASHALAIRRNVARLLALPEKHVNFKATTEEGLGFTGQEQGLKAVALVSGLRQE